MNKKIFVYDCSKGFASLLKHYYSDKIHIECYADKKKFLVANFENYDASFFMINNPRDFIIFEDLFDKIKNVFVITPIKFYAYKINSMQMKNVVILDFNNDVKREMIKTINFNLELKNII